RGGFQGKIRRAWSAGPDLMMAGAGYAGRAKRFCARMKPPCVSGDAAAVRSQDRTRDDARCGTRQEDRCVCNLGRLAETPNRRKAPLNLRARAVRRVSFRVGRSGMQEVDGDTFRAQFTRQS